MAAKKRSKRTYACPGCKYKSPSPRGLGKHYAESEKCRTASSGRRRQMDAARHRVKTVKGRKSAKATHGLPVRKRRRAMAKPKPRNTGLAYCTKCGEKVQASWVFCGHCGSPVG